MPEDATLEVKLLTKVEKEQVEKALAEIQKIIGGTPINLNVKGDAAKDAGKEKKTSIIGEMLGGIGSMSKILLQIFGAVSIIKVIANVFRPAIKIIGMVFKIIGEFFRPVAEMLMILLMPILAILKPLLVTFRTLMLPFRKAAMVGTAAAMKLIGMGMKLGAGTEEGAALIGEGLKGAISAASLMMSGFLEILFTPLAKLLGLGPELETAMNAWQDSALEGILRAHMLAETIIVLNKGWDDLRKSAVKALELIQNQVDILRESVETFTIEGFETALSKADEIIKATGEAFVGSLDGLETAVEALDTTIEEFISDLTKGTNTMSDLNAEVRDYIKNLTEMTRLNMLRNDAEKRANELLEKKPSILNKLGSAFNNLINKFITEPIGAITRGELAEFPNIINTFKEGWTIPESDWKALVAVEKEKFVKNWENFFKEEDLAVLEKTWKAGLDHIHAVTKDYMEYSLIPDAWASGMEHILTNTKKTTEKLKTDFESMTVKTQLFSTAIIDTAKVVDQFGMLGTKVRDFSNNIMTAADTIASASTKVVRAQRDTEEKTSRRGGGSSWTTEVKEYGGAIAPLSSSIKQGGR